MAEDKKIEINKKLLLLLSIVIVLYLILQLLQIYNNSKLSNYKYDKNKDYVYTKYSSSLNKATVPYINILSKDVEKINEEIINISKEYLSSNNPDKTVSYRYNQNKNILSIVLTYRDVDSEQRLNYSFKTYVFDLKNKGKLLTNEEIINKFNISYVKINEIMSNQMKEKYSDELKKGYLVKEECDYNCFLEMRKINNYIDNANYYIENGHLVVYRAFDIYSIYNEEEYYTRNDFKFIIK